MKGKITKMNAYKSGQGFFIGINGTDYMFFGSAQAKIGDEVQFEEGKPSKDGTPTIKSIKPSGLEEFVDEDKPRSQQVFRAHDQKDSREEYWKAKEKRDLEQLPANIRSACLASASEIGRQDAEQVVLIAKRFEKYVREGV